MNEGRWTKEEEQFLKENYKDLTYREIGEKLNRKEGSVGAKANRLGLIKSKGKKVKQEELDFIRKNYKEMTDEKLGRKLGLTVEQVKYRKVGILRLKSDKGAKTNKGMFELEKYEKERIKAYTAAFINLSSVEIGRSVCPQVPAKYIDKVKEHIIENNLRQEYSQKYWGE